MKVSQKALVSALKSVSVFAAVKGVLPILDHVRIHKPPGDKVFLYCTDLERFASTTIQADDEGDFTLDFCVNAKDLLAMTASINDSELDLTLDTDKKLLIRGKTSKAKIKVPTAPSFEYPGITAGNAVGSFNISSEKLFSLVKKTAPFVSNDTTKVTLSNINIVSKDSKLSFRACDGYTLSVQNEDVDCGFELNILLAGHTADHCVRLFGSDKEEVKVTVYENYVQFEKGNYCVYCRLGSGRFGNVDCFIPKSYAQTIEVKADELKAAINLISAANNKEIFKKINVSYLDSQSLMLSAKGDYLADAPISAVATGGSFDVRKFNITYFQRVVNSVSGDKVVLHMNEANKQLIVSGGDPSASLFAVFPIVDSQEG